jgi:excisionase family DNA binding protein
MEENYSIKEAAGRTGVSVKTLRRVIHCGALRAYKPGRAIRIREKDLNKWFLATRLRPRALSTEAAELLADKGG